MRRHLSARQFLPIILLPLWAIGGCDPDSGTDPEVDTSPEEFPAEASPTPPEAPSNTSDTWDPGDDDYGAFFRNNTIVNYSLSAIAKVTSASSCSTSEYKFPNGAATDVDAGKIVEALNLDSSDCRTNSSSWEFILTRDDCTSGSSGYASYTFQVQGNGSISSDDGTTFYAESVEKTLSFCGNTVTVNLQGRDSFHASGVYITIGTDPFGKIGPTRDSSQIHKLTVVSYNTYMGTDTKPEECDRSEYMKSALFGLKTDVLVLNEMNLREGGCFDGMELAAYLWTGDESDEGDDWIENDANGYADSTSGSGTSPNGNDLYADADGAFPYISQWVSGIAVNGDEWQTGGTLILSKYPLEMVENYTYSDVNNSEEQKGFVAVKITKSYQGSTQDYYILATHTNASLDPQEDQIAEIAAYLATGDIAEGSRVIIAGDLNNNGQSGELASLGMSATGYPSQTKTAYYPYSRDSSINFYHNSGSEETIDWAQPVACNFDYTPPSSYSWYVFPIRETDFKFAELSDHFAVAGIFTYPSSNTPPTACDVAIAVNSSTRTGSYTYDDAESTAEVTTSSTYQWYRATSAEGTDIEVISGATSTTYTVTTDDTGKFLTFCARPSDGTNLGVTTCSAWDSN